MAGFRVTARYIDRMMAYQRIVRLRITGLVQGVGFRAFVQDEALRRGLDGWVRNRRDRSVEALAAGAAEEVGEFVIACRHGPPGSQVEALETLFADETALAEGRSPGFTILPTV